MRRRGPRNPGRPAALGVEQVESRRLLAGAPLPTPVGYPPVGIAPPAVIAPLATPAIPVAVVPSADPLFGYAFTLVTPERAAGYDFTTQADRPLAGIDVGLVDAPLGATLDLEVLSGLQYWDGRGQPAFAAVRGGVEINLESAGADLRVGATTDRLPGQPAGTLRRSIEAAVSAGLPVARRIQATIGVGGTRESFATPGAPAGIYAFTGLWSVRNATGIRASAPMTFVFAIGGASRQARDAAVAACAAPSGRPAAIVAVATEVVTPQGPGQSYLRVSLQYSDPVGVTGRAPQLPIFFDRRQRLASLEPGSAATGTRTLSFALVPTATDRAATAVRLGDALRLQSGGTLRASAGGTAVLSLPPEAARDRVIGLDPAPALISADIVRDTTLRRGTTYLVDGEIHVRSGVTLTIEDGVTVLIRNGRRPQRTLDTSALVFDSGSRLRAATVTFGSADAQDRRTSLADNGGVFFLGTARSCTKDGISVDASAPSGRSSFVADLVVLDSLGRADPLAGDGDDAERDDIDAISLLGLASTEWRVKAVRSDNSGDDGFDVTNSSIALDALTVVNPAEDGLNVTSSTVQIRRSLTVAMSASVAPDRELFDLEVDGGPARVAIDRFASVDLRGYWGSVYAEVGLNSLDMPAPPRRGTSSQWYVYAGTLQRGPAIVYSTRAD